MRHAALLFAVTLLYVFDFPNARARSYHVATNGNDQQPGSEVEPLRTINKGTALARAGDTVLVREGVYKEHVFLRFSGEPDKPIVLRNYPGDRPIVDGEGRGRIELKSEKGWQKPIGWIVVEGFEARHGWDGIKFYNAHDIVLRGNRLHDNLNQGILGNGHHVRIEGNVIAHNGFKPDNEKSNLEHGIYCTGSHFTIVNNVICSNKAYGIQVAGYPFKAESHAGPDFAGAQHWLISHNTIAFQQNRGGIVLWQPEAADCIIQNNIFYKNTVTPGSGALQGIDRVGAGAGHIVRNNLFFAPDRRSFHKSPNRYATADNLENIDPLFLDAERCDFHLSRQSPAIDAGVRENDLRSDAERRPRPLGQGYDLGAYEYPPEPKL